MSNVPVDRSALTALMVTEAKKSGVPIGRGSAPKEGGWTSNEFLSDFVDYVVIKAGPASSPAPGEPERLGVYATSWDTTTQVIGHGETEEGCDKVAGLVVKQLFSIDGTVMLDDVEWTVQRIVVPRISQTEWSNQTKTWRVTYDVSLHLSRVRTR